MQTRMSFKSKTATFFSAAALLLLQITAGLAQDLARGLSAQQVQARVVPSNAEPQPGTTINADVFIDTRGIVGADNRLGSYQARLRWNTSVLQFVNATGGDAPWNAPIISTQQTNSGIVDWLQTLAGGAAPADFRVFRVNFRVVGTAGNTSPLDLSFSEMNSSTFRNILSLVEVKDSTVTVNAPPTIDPIANQTITEGARLTLTVKAQDTPGNVLRLESRQFPTFVTLQDNGDGSGSVTIAPPLGFVGVYTDLQVIVFDDGSPALSDTATFAVTVTRLNTPPELAPIADQTIVEGQARVISVSATDAQNDPLTLRAVNFPSFVSLDDNGGGQGVISLDPPLGSAGTYPNLSVIVFETNDNTFADTVTFNLSVRGAEPPPKLDAIPDTSMSEGEVLTLAVRATKGTGTDDIFLSVKNLPTFGSFTDNNDGTGSIRFAPDFTQAGVYANIVVTAQDTSNPPLKDSVAFTLTVRNVNRPPKLEPIAFDSFTIDEGENFGLTLRASDPDNDSLRFSVQNLPSFGALVDNRNGTATVRFTPGNTDSGTYPNLKVVVTDNGSPNLSDSDVFELVVRDVIQALTCSVKISEPLANAVVCDDTATVCLEVKVTGGAAPIRGECFVNGVLVPERCAYVPLVPGWNTLIANCKVTDAQGNVCTSSDTVRVFSNVLQAKLTVTSPTKDSTFICANTITVTAKDSVSSGIAPFKRICTINGDTLQAVGGVFGKTVALTPGYNSIIAACTSTDSLGCSITVRDTVTVFSDATPAETKLNFNNLPIITGEVIDNESGIAKIEIVEINNRVVTIAPFKVGDKRVTFSSDKIDPNLRSGFVLRVTNLAGCSVLADPVNVKLDPAAGLREHTFDMQHTDRFLYVNNRGLQKIYIMLNGRALNLVANEEGEGRSGSTYFMAKEGQRLIDIASYLHEGENRVQVKCDAMASGYADLLFADVQLGEIDNSIILPTAFALNQNYPNPFNPTTTIVFDIPENWAAPVTLRIFNMQGQLIQTLVDGVMAPGRHEIVWNGRDVNGQPVATGIYFYQVLSGEVKAVKKMQMVK